MCNKVLVSPQSHRTLHICVIRGTKMYVIVHTHTHTHTHKANMIVVKCVHIIWACGSRSCIYCYIFGLRIIECMDNYGSCIYCFILRPWNFVFDNKVELTFRVLYQTQDPYPRLILESYHTNFPTLRTWCIWLIVLREAETQWSHCSSKLCNFTITQK